MNSRVDSWLRASRLLGLFGFVGGMAALASLWAFGPRPADGAQWRLLIHAMRSIFYPCVFVGIILLLVSGTSIWWRRRRSLNRQRWFQVMMAMVFLSVPALHLWARFTMLRLDAAVNASDLARAQQLWDTLGTAYVAATIIFTVVSMIGLLKPRFGQVER